MKKACLVVSGPYVNNQIFDRQNSHLNRDNCLAFFHFLQDEFAAQGVRLETQDISPPQDCEYVIYNEMPKTLPTGSDRRKSFVLLFESELIRPDNWNVNSHSHFAKIFTWHDDFVDNKRYFKMNFTHDGGAPKKTFEQKQKFCTLIAGNKSVNHPLELYSQRKLAIRWFEQNHPDQFEFYGMGWEQFTFTGPKLFRTLNKISFLRKALAEKWPSFRGAIDSKLETLSQYKFSICYENAQGIPGYITEKIFDSMAAGCLPVYWGAPNILNYVPEDCFIDRRKFKNDNELYEFLSRMSASEYNRRLEEIEKYLVSPQHQPFRPGPAAKAVALNILGAS